MVLEVQANHSYLLTPSLEQSPSWEANWFSASQEIPHISRKPKVHYRTHKRLPPVWKIRKIIHRITNLWEMYDSFFGHQKRSWCESKKWENHNIKIGNKSLGPRRDEVMGEWRRLHNEELSDLYSSPNTVRLIKWRRMRWTGHVAHMGEERGVYRLLLGKPDGKRPLGKPRHWWVDNIRMDLQEVGCGLAQGRDRWRTLVSAVMNLRVPWNAGNFLTSCKPVSFSRRTLHHGVSK